MKREVFFSFLEDKTARAEETATDHPVAHLVSACMRCQSVKVAENVPKDPIMP